jgi:hypothetical protein
MTDLDYYEDVGRRLQEARQRAHDAEAEVERLRAENALYREYASPDLTALVEGELKRLRPTPPEQEG